MNRMKVMFLLLFCLTIVVAGCSGNGNGGNSNPTNTNNGEQQEEPPKTNNTPNNVEKTSVSFTYWGSDFDKERMEKIYAEFSQVHPEIEVKLIQIPNDGYDQKMLVSMASAQPYDIIQLEESFYSYAAKGTLEDLTPFMERDNIAKEDYYEAAIEAYSYDDKVMGMPMRIGSMIMLYNKNLFDKNNVAYPDDSWTWDDFLEGAI
ncbi:ABC transporter substrate-binding protein [Paenibacillus yanchengensis]|uniref:ABC transporter substrate-binding protein n=1 Tax=Paenibacillus yanchengensis TaxID=2035833 RepID=A0ABW4YR98_9BACL